MEAIEEFELLYNNAKALSTSLLKRLEKDTDRILDDR
jgi:hypothetical protein